MAATGYSPIQLYYSTTASAAPTAGNLASGELAINITDGKLYYKDNAGAVQLLSTSTTANGTANGVLYLNGSKVATAGTALVFDGTNLGVGGASEPFGRGYGRWVGVSSASTVGLELNAATGSGVYFDLGVNGARTFNIYSDASSTAIQTANTNPLTFGINFTEAMRLTSTGLGIGTSSPAYKLDVEANASTGANNSATGSVTRFRNIYTRSRANSAGISGDLYAGQLFHVSGGAAFELYNADNFPLVFGTNSTEKMRLDSSGNLGLGVTPSAGSTHIDVSAGGSFYGLGNGAQLAANSNFSSGSWLYRSSAFASRIDINPGNAGGVAFYTAASGTAGDAISFTQAMTLDASGNLGIGTSSPAYKLEVNGQIGCADNFVFTTANPAMVVNSGYLRFFTGGSERLRLDTSGNLGIGTSSPAARLDLNASGSNAQMAVQNWPMMRVVGTTLDIGGYNASQWTQTRLYTNGNIAATLDSSGNLGLGVTPAAWNNDTKMIDIGSSVSVGNSYGGPASLVYNAAQTTAGSGAWRYRIAASVPAGLYTVDSTHKWYTAPSGTAGNAISFTQAMTLDSSGNLLVGTTTAVEKVTVNGRVQSQWDAYVNGGSTSYSGDATSLVTGSSAGMWAARSDSALLFAIGSNEKARIDSSGNLGLGVTPSAWGPTFRAMDIGAFASVFCESSVTADIASNTYYKSGVGFTYRNNGYATMLRQEGGAYKFYNSSSGTAGNAITFTQAMTLDASGNLLLGTTTNLSSSFRASIEGGRLGVASASNAYALYLRYNNTTSGFYIGSPSADTLSFSNNAGTEVARIDSSGNLLVGTTAPTYSTDKVAIQPTSSNGTGIGIAIGNFNTFGIGIYNGYTATGTATALQFQDHNSVVRGSITVTTSATAYNTSSDYRLKENIAPMTGALAKVAALKPVTYTWKADGAAGEGFIAHELAEVCPQAVTGEKDAVDAEGKPQYQGIDVSFLVGTLTAAIQEQQTLIQQLTDRVAQLESK